MSFSPIIRVRKLLDKMKSERGDSPRLHKRFHSRYYSDDSTGCYSSPNLRPKKSAKPSLDNFNSQSLELVNETFNEEIGEDEFLNLPIEATLLIFSFLEKEDLEATRSVSKYWNELSDDECLWKELCIQDWNIKHLHEKTWKRTYYKLHEVLGDGVWEGMSRWVHPVGFDNEQRTTARLNFQKRSSRVNSPMPSPVVSSKSEIHRCASTTVPSQLTSMNTTVAPQQTVNTTTNATDANATTAIVASSSGSSESTATVAKEAELRVHGSGITINCAAPSPFKIEGERTTTDMSGTTFRWNKLFERHTSLYEGKINFADGTVTGTIDYNDGNTHWKGEFHYKKVNRVRGKFTLNA